MAVRLKRALALTLASDTDLKQLIASRDRSITDDTLSVGNAGHFIVAPATNLQIPLGELASIRALFLEYDGALRLRFAAAGDYTALNVITTGQTGVFYGELGAPTLLYLENTSATASVKVFVAMAGPDT